MSAAVSRPHRTILANLISDVMAEHPTAAYRRAMAAVTPRKLWQALPGDCVVTLAPITPAFRDYVQRTIGLDVDQVDVIAPSEVVGVHALDIAAERGVLDHIATRPELAPFVLDQPVLTFARRNGIRVLPYIALPDRSAVDAVLAINTKDFFRRIAATLGLPIAEGGHAATPQALTAALTAFLTDHPAAIIKRNRGSNGFGNTVVRADDPRSVAEQVEAAIDGQPAPSGWVYEQFLDFTALPSIEMIIGEDGPQDFYTCDQVTVNNAWTGMVTPAADCGLGDDLAKAAATIGGWLFDRGYRGVFDVDCGVFDTGFVLSESNVRRTGGSYLHELARAVAPESATTLHWRADARVGSSNLDFSTAVDRLDRAGLTQADAVRTVLTADTLAIDGKRRYLVVGQDPDTVAEVEAAVVRELGID